MSKINVRQIEARASGHKGQVLRFDDLGNADPGAVEEKHIDQPTRKKFAYSQVLEAWDLDVGTQPLFETVGSYNVNTFLGYDDTAIYKDIDLGNAYDETKPLFIRYQYGMSLASTDAVKIEVDYEFMGDTFDVNASLTNIHDYFNPGLDTSFHTRTVELPIQSGLGSFPKLTLKFSRLGESDDNLNDFRLFSIMIYQEAS